MESKQKSVPIPIINSGQNTAYITPTSASSFSPVKFRNKDYGRDIQSKSNIIKYFSHNRFTPPKSEDFLENSPNDAKLSESPVSSRKPQFYKSTNGFRLTFCNLTNEERKLNIAQQYKRKTKDQRDKFINQRRKSEIQENLFSESLLNYYNFHESTKLEMENNLKMNRRKSQYKTKITTSSTAVQRECFKFDAKSRLDHLRRYMKQTKKSREARIWANRDLYLMGLSNDKQNLGNALNITEQFNENLSYDHNQSVIVSNYFLNPLEWEGNIFKFITIKDETQMEYIPELKTLFNQANDMIKNEFLHKEMEVSLDWSMEEGMTVDLFVKEIPSLFHHIYETVGICEYIFMKKYLWLEVITVKEEFRNNGIGRLLMDRISDIARNRNKDILLYALNDVVPFYLHLGFEFSPKFPHKPYHDGYFMIKKISSA
jgi:GNAT superfamily N-acetyltransferase